MAHNGVMFSAGHLETFRWVGMADLNPSAPYLAGGKETVPHGHQSVRSSRVPGDFPHLVHGQERQPSLRQGLRAQGLAACDSRKEVAKA
jgi:hypothetical protein